GLKKPCASSIINTCTLKPNGQRPRIIDVLTKAGQPRVQDTSPSATAQGVSKSVVGGEGQAPAVELTGAALGIAAVSRRTKRAQCSQPLSGGALGASTASGVYGVETSAISSAVSTRL